MEITKRVEPEAPAETGRSKLMIGVIPCLNELFMRAAWPMVKDDVKEMAEASKGEYTDYQVYQAVYYGQAHLYLGFVDRTGQVPDNQAQAFVANKILNGEAKDLAGFMIVRMDATAVHLWQGFVKPEFQGENVLELAIEYIKQQAKNTGAPHLSFATYRKGWERAAKKLGFEETYTIFRCRLN
jgi:GNAT superfamily N-acetyltransferase